MLARFSRSVRHDPDIETPLTQGEGKTMYAIAGVTGHTGKVVADTLLSQGKKVRVIVRSEDKGKSFKARGAEVALGSVDDAAALATALKGAEGAYLLVPPNLTHPDPVAGGRKVVDAIGAALAQAKVPHVVFLSSLGAQHASGNGPIQWLHYAEQALPKAAPGTRFTFVRAGYFMENLGGMVGSVKGNGVLPAIFNPEKKINMIATHDIGTTAVKALVEPPAATQVIELDGPVEYSYAEAAREFAAALGKPVNVFRIPPEGVEGGLTQAGVPAPFARLYKELGEGLDKGIVAFEGKGARRVHGATTLATVIKQLVA
jgi:uncharacterized protein YbjT (DUF2867 family)